MLILSHLLRVFDEDGATLGVERAFSDAIGRVTLRGGDAGDVALDGNGAANTLRTAVGASSAADARGILAARGRDGAAVDEDIAADAIATDGVSATNTCTKLATSGRDVGRAAYLDAVSAGTVFAAADACAELTARGRDGAAGAGDFAA